MEAAIDARELMTHPASSLGLQDAKFIVPRSGQGMVPRAGLVGQLRAASDRRILSIVAPPGYGKTTTLAQWATDRRFPVAWVTVDDGDNDPVVLFTDVAIALHQQEPLDSGVFDALRAPGTPIRTLVGRLLAARSDRGTPIRLALDDVHLVTNRTCIDALSELIARLPPGGQIAIAGRQDVGLPLPRWRSQRDLLEVGVDELVFDQGEANQLAHQLGVDLPPDDARQLIEKSEGWPAGIYLAALAMANQSQRSGPLVSGDLPYVADYIRTEVLGRIDSDTAAFLRRSAILDRLSGSFCDAVAGVSGSTSKLEAMARTNQLVITLGQRQGYRYHTLLREFLLAELEDREPELVPELHRRASVWYEQHAQPVSAIEHAFAAGDVDRAATLFGGVALELHNSGRAATVKALLDRFDRPTLERQPWLATLLAWMGVLHGDAELAERMAAVVERSAFEGVPPDGTASFESGRAMLRVFLGRGGPTGMRANADLAIASESEASPWWPGALDCGAIASMAAGDEEEATARFEETIAAATAASAWDEVQVALACKAFIAIASGRWGDAGTLVEQSEAVIDRWHLETYAVSALTRAAAARVRIHRGDIDSARESLAKAQVLRPKLTVAMPWLSVRCLLELARACLALGDPAGARAVLRQAEDILVRRPDLGPLSAEVKACRRVIAGLPAGLASASTLTEAELRVLAWLPLYLTFKEIAERLGVKPSTVKSHTVAIYGKLGASTRSEAVALAVLAGLLEGFPT